MTRKRKKSKVVHVPAKPLPGSHKVRQHAKKLSAEWVDDDQWHVTGGQGEHVVTAGMYGKPDTFTCDCSSRQLAKDKLCSHVLAVMREM